MKEELGRIKGNVSLSITSMVESAMIFDNIPYERPYLHILYTTCQTSLAFLSGGVHNSLSPPNSSILCAATYTRSHARSDCLSVDMSLDVIQLGASGSLHCEKKYLDNL
jgi:hypothetical protein